MKLKKILFPLMAVGLLVNLPLAYGADQPDVPVEDLSVEQSQAAELNQTSEPDNAAAKNGDRIERLEQQMSNITNMNMPQQINGLRQEVQQLNGQIQEQQHAIKVLQDQQRRFYQDLDRRLQQMGSSKGLPAAQKPQSNTADASAPASQSDSSAYRSAFNLLVKKRYDDALSAFQDYLNQHPKGKFAPNAYYWMGELYLKRNDTMMASKSFSTVLSRYPDSNKVPDAKLKLAIIHIAQGKKDQARQELNKIKREYPNSTAAQLASIQLQRMGQ